MAEKSQETIRMEIANLRLEHRDLDVAIQSLEADQVHDQLRLSRLKRQKLQLKDKIAALEDQLHPDIIA